MSRLTVLPIRNDEVLDARYDIAVAACGFESRSRFFFDTSGIRASRNIVTDYGHRHGVAYKENKRWFEAAGFERVNEDDTIFVSRLTQALSSSGVNGNFCRVIVDISSLTRARLASLLMCLWCHDKRDVEIDFVYSLAKYYSPPADVPIDHVGPVGPLFAGWTDAPELPTSAVFGLGFEPGKVLGAAEYLEAGDVFACIPDGPDPRFKRAVLKSNSALLGELGSDHVVNYSVGNPFDTFVWIEGLCSGLLRHSRPVLIPFGPKIFALNCMLVALVHAPQIMVLRVSGFGSEDRDVHAAGQVYRTRARIQATGKA